jgi:formate dehydrogenase subunit gamma
MTSHELRRLIAPHANEIGGPLSALRTIQQQHGWIAPDAVDAVADVFNLSRAEVRGLVGFYADFRTSPPATHVLRICQAEACQSVGARELTRSLSDRLGIALGGTTPDRRVGLEGVYCLGLCTHGPALMVDGRLVVGADAAADRVLEELEPPARMAAG